MKITDTGASSQKEMETIIMKEGLAEGQSEIKELVEGRLLRIRTRYNNLKISIQNIHQPSGLDNHNKEDLEVAEEIIEKACNITGITDLDIISGDFNETNEEDDRIRGEEIKSEKVGDGRVINKLFMAKFEDTHVNDKEMTHSQGKGGRRTDSRIDRIFIRTKKAFQISHRSVREVEGFTSDHKMVHTHIEGYRSGGVMVYNEV